MKNSCLPSLLLCHLICNKTEKILQLYCSVAEAGRVEVQRKLTLFPAVPWHFSTYGTIPHLLWFKMYVESASCSAWN